MESCCQRIVTATLVALAFTSCRDESAQDRGRLPGATGAGAWPQDRIVEGKAPPQAELGTLDFRIVHRPGGTTHAAHVAILRTGTMEVVWADTASVMKVPLRAGSYDVRIDRLGGSTFQRDLMVRAGETSRVELVSDTGALKLEAAETPNGAPIPALLTVTRTDSTAAVWSGTEAQTTVIVPAGLYDVQCARNSRQGLTSKVLVRAGEVNLARCVVR